MPLSAARSRRVHAGLLVLFVASAWATADFNPTPAATADPPTPDPSVAAGPADPLPPASAWLQAARTGTPLAVPLGDRTVEVELRSNAELFDDAFWTADAEGAPVDLGGVHPLAGVVVDVPGSSVRATVFEGRVVGDLYLPGEGTYPIGSTADGEGVLVDAATPLDYDRDAPVDEVETGLLGPFHLPDTTGCLQLTPQAVADPSGLATGWPTRTFQVSFSVDAEFVAVRGAAWAGWVVAFINGMDGFYAREIDLRIAATDIHSHAAATFPGGDTDTLLGNLRGHYNAAHAGLFREDAHLFTGKNLDGAVGQADCIGGAGNPNAAYTVGEGAFLEPEALVGGAVGNLLGKPVQLADAYVKVSAHELAHILSAHHHYANCGAESHVSVDHATPRVGANVSRPLDACTLMINFINLGALEFSATNRLVTRGWADVFNL